MSQLKQNQVTDAETADSRWNWLYKIGGIAALIVVVLTPIQSFIFIAYPPPSTVIDYFTLFQNNKILGLLDLDLLLTANNVLLILIYLALYAALRRANESFMVIALTFGLIGIVLYLISREATFTMLSLSHQYTVATTDAQRSIFLAAGQVMLTIYNGTAFDMSYVLSGVVLLIISVVMLRSNIFSKVTSYMGILMGVLMLVPPTVGTIGLLLSLISLVPMFIWLILVARRFFQLGRSVSNEEANRIGGIS
jgi:hypothetical protein